LAIEARHNFFEFSVDRLFFARGRMDVIMVSRVVSNFRDPKRLFFLTALLCVALFAAHDTRSFAGLDFDIDLPPSGEAAEHYVLPITPPLDQGDSGLCWVYAALSMLETNYIVRNPGSHIALSRGGLQLDAIADRFQRRLRGDPGGRLDDGGLAVEALALIRQNGLLAEGDFHDIVDSEAIFSSVEDKLARSADPADTSRTVDEELKASLGVKPPSTHLDDKPVSPRQLAEAMLGGHEFVEFDLARDGMERWGPSQDPDARPETRVRYVPLDVMIDLIHQSLAEGRAVLWGSADHALLIYGGDYDREGQPMSYLIKDSFAPYTYRRSADDVHRVLNDVTVALDDGTSDQNGPAAASQAKQSRPPAALVVKIKRLAADRKAGVRK